MVHLHKGTVLSCLRNDILKFVGRWMELEKKKTHHKQDSTDPKGQTLYTLTFKRIKINK